MILSSPVVVLHAVVDEALALVVPTRGKGVYHSSRTGPKKFNNFLINLIYLLNCVSFITCKSNVIFYKFNVINIEQRLTLFEIKILFFFFYLHKNDRLFLENDGDA